MCSILFSTKKHDKDKIEQANKILQLRGPDHTTVLEVRGHTYVHNLLSITGTFTKQPYISDDIYLIYNGEIYNYKEFGDYSSDGECIIPLYKEYGPDFVKHLDGEFAIVLVDYSKNIVVISADPFKTKPLFLAREGNNIAACTYRTPLEILGYKGVKKAQPNMYYVIDLSTMKTEYSQLTEYDLNQHKDSYEDWLHAFQRSIEKRVQNTNKNFFLGLSSGYDSGIILSELQRLHIPSFTYSLLGTENEEVIRARLSQNPDFIKSFLRHKSDTEYAESHRWIVQNTEPFNYTIKSSTSNYVENGLLVDDWGSNNFATICKMAREQNCRICFSGTGADEIISDYGFNGTKIYNHSNFGGKFPADLKTIFPWASFYESTMESYIAKEEYVGGSFGIEMRYPFLDPKVVQEFLWLTPELKNKEYKAPIDYYFNKYNISYAKGEKKGF